jgi:hypothetical protein
MFSKLRLTAVALAAALPLVTLAACDQGPAEKAGKDIDRATNSDGLVTKGPAQKAGRNLDNAVGDKR